MILYNLSKCLPEFSLESSEIHELQVEHLIDVVKPIIWFLHSQCFELPENYDLDYIKRLLNAISFFDPICVRQLYDIINPSLCHKFVNVSFFLYFKRDGKESDSFATK